MAQKDLMIVLKGDVQVYQGRGGREVAIPDIYFFRYTKASPEAREKTERLFVQNGEILLSLARQEHVMDVQQLRGIGLVQNVGLDGRLEQEGDYKIAGHNKVRLYPSPDYEGTEVEITYTYRHDGASRSVVMHKRDASVQDLGRGWQVISVREEALLPVSAHDTAAMSGKTQLSLSVVPLDEYVYSADTYIVAVISGKGVVSQYY